MKHSSGAFISHCVNEIYVGATTCKGRLHSVVGVASVELVYEAPGEPARAAAPGTGGYLLFIIVLPQRGPPIAWPARSVLRFAPAR